MSWNTDKEPIDYLRQRIKYYKKKVSKTTSLLRIPEMQAKYGDDLPYIVGRRLMEIESYISMYKKAVRDLEAIEQTDENK